MTTLPHSDQPGQPYQARASRRHACDRLAKRFTFDSAEALANLADKAGTAAKWAAEVHAATMKEHEAEGVTCRHRDWNRTHDLEAGAEELVRSLARVRRLRGELTEAITANPHGSEDDLVRGVAAELTERTFTGLARLVTSRALPAAQCIAVRIPEADRAAVKGKLEQRTGEVLHRIGIMRERFTDGRHEAARWLVGAGTIDVALLAAVSLSLDLIAQTERLDLDDDASRLLRTRGERTGPQLTEGVRSMLEAAEGCVSEAFMVWRALHPALADVARAVAEPLQDRLIVGRGAKQVPDAATWTRLGQALRGLRLAQQPLDDLS